MVFLRPKIIRSAEDARKALAEVDQRAPTIQKYQDESVPADVGKKTKGK
jgi:type II secretory pathway component GspD/PulD (secretin)